MSVKVKVKKNDQVVILAGKDRTTKAKATVGKVLKVFPKEGTVIVERVNQIKRHTRPNPQRQVQGGIVEREAPIKIANVMVICPECGKASRLGRVRLADGTAARVCKKCKAVVN